MDGWRSTQRGRSSRAALVAAFLASSLALLGGASAAAETDGAAIPKLSVLPVTILSQALILAGDSRTFEVLAYNKSSAGAHWQTVDGDVTYANLASLTDNVGYPATSAFELDVVNIQRSPSTTLRMVFEATSAPCLVSTIDPRLVHIFTPGRVIRVSAVYFKDATRLARANMVKTLCTAFNGELAIVLGEPVSDMLPTTIITYDNTGNKAAVSQINFDFPTYAW